MYGIEIRDADGKVTLDNSYFTMRRIYDAAIPAQARANGQGIRNNTLIYSIPGYSAAKCFVVITPVTYVQSVQPGEADAGPFCPYYVDLGGETIGVIRHIQDRRYISTGGDWRLVDWWQAYTPACRLEVFEVF